MDFKLRDRVIIPDATDTKALFIIDVQPLTLKGDLPTEVTQKIVRFIQRVPYDAYVLAEYHAPRSSMFYKQGGFTRSEEETGRTGKQITCALKPHEDKLFHVRKTTRSCFKGSDPKGLKTFLNQREIEEIHFVGFDINDCVLASAYEAIDSGYYSFVLEELTHQQSGIQGLADAALTIIRSMHMTNNSLHKIIRYREVDLEDRFDSSSFK
jgi:nicotinamidase-related amidase